MMIQVHKDSQNRHFQPKIFTPLDILEDSFPVPPSAKTVLLFLSGKIYGEFDVTKGFENIVRCGLNGIAVGGEGDGGVGGVHHVDRRCHRGGIRRRLDSLQADQEDALYRQAYQLLTTPRELKKSGSLAERLPELLDESTKPVIAVVDSGSSYESLVHGLRTGHVPTFRSTDQAIRSLGRYLCHRTGRTRTPQRPEEPGLAVTEQIPTEVHV